MTKQAEYSKKHYQANRTEIMRKNVERTQTVRRWVLNYKKSHPCIYCGEPETCCLDFHHRDAAAKIMSVAIAIQYGWSVERIKTEIAKCDMVCSNCHRKIHAGVITHPILTDINKCDNIKG